MVIYWMDNICIFVSDTQQGEKVGDIYISETVRKEMEIHACIWVKIDGKREVNDVDKGIVACCCMMRQ